MKRINLNERGGALLIVLGILLMLTVAGLIAVDTAQTDIELSRTARCNNE